jgi:large subunit ribosomal protein L15
MAIHLPAPMVFQALRPAKRRLTCECLISPQTFRQPSAQYRQALSTGPSHLADMEVDGQPRPRWSYTPPAMAAPARASYREPGVKQIKVNSDPKKLDQVYVRFLGPGGDQMLKEETKWLAVTHKSFDHARRGFNDRLAFLGKFPS